MFRPVPQRRSSVSFLYFLVAVAMLVVAAPQLRVNLSGWHGVFLLSWIVFAIIVIASNLWFALGVSRDRMQQRMPKAKMRHRVTLPQSQTRQRGRGR